MQFNEYLLIFNETKSCIEIFDIIELKSVAELQPVNFSQLLTYLRLTNLKLGLLINFGQRRMIDGIHRVVNGLPK